VPFLPLVLYECDLYGLLGISFSLKICRFRSGRENLLWTNSRLELVRSPCRLRTDPASHVCPDRDDQRCESIGPWQSVFPISHGSGEFATVVGDLYFYRHSRKSRLLNRRVCHGDCYPRRPRGGSWCGVPSVLLFWIEHRDGLRCYQIRRPQLCHAAAGVFVPYSVRNLDCDERGGLVSGLIGIIAVAFLHKMLRIRYVLMGIVAIALSSLFSLQ
jgi:hypothetical protein